MLSGAPITTFERRGDGNVPARNGGVLLPLVVHETASSSTRAVGAIASRYPEQHGCKSSSARDFFPNVATFASISPSRWPPLADASLRRPETSGAHTKRARLADSTSSSGPSAGATTSQSHSSHSSGVRIPPKVKQSSSPSAPSPLTVSTSAAAAAAVSGGRNSSSSSSSPSTPSSTLFHSSAAAAGVAGAAAASADVGGRTDGGHSTGAMLGGSSTGSVPAAAAPSRFPTATASSSSGTSTASGARSSTLTAAGESNIGGRSSDGDSCRRSSSTVQRNSAKHS